MHTFSTFNIPTCLTDASVTNDRRYKKEQIKKEDTKILVAEPNRDVY